MSKLQDLIYGQQTSADTPSVSDIASSKIEKNPHPQGVWQILAQFARLRGMTRLERLAGLKEEQERLDKGDERKLRMSEIEQRMGQADLDKRYKEELITDIKHRNGLQDQDQAMQEDAALAKSTQDRFEADKGYDEPTGRTSGFSTEGDPKWDVKTSGYESLVDENGDFNPKRLKAGQFEGTMTPGEAQNAAIPDSYNPQGDARTVYLGNGQTSKQKPESRQSIERRRQEAKTFDTNETMRVNASKPVGPAGYKVWAMQQLEEGKDAGYEQYLRLVQPNNIVNGPGGPTYQPKLDAVGKSAPEPVIQVDTADQANPDKKVTQVLPRSTASGQTFAGAPTSGMQDRAEARTRLQPLLKQMKEMSARIISKIGVAQRLNATVRGVDAAFGNDPEFRTYQDSKNALAATLAVAQQGTRPSDVDVLRVWAPKVPDPYRDTAESQEQKWRMIDIELAQTPGTGGAEAPDPARQKLIDTLNERLKRRQGGR